MSRPPAPAHAGAPTPRPRAGRAPARLAEIGRLDRVAVVRALQLGDLLCAVPALRALRAALPDSRIVLVGLPWAASFVRRFRHHLDGFLAFPGYPGLPERTPDLSAVPLFLAEAHRERFDLVIQLHGSGEITNPLAVLLGGRATAGFFRPGGFCPDPQRFLVYPDDEPERRRHLQLMQFLGVPPRGEQLEFPLEDEDRREAGAALAGLAGRRYACVHPGARAPERRWRPAAFARVADAIAEDGVSVVLTGVEEEAPLTAAVARRMRAPAVDLAGRLSLGGLAALIAGARVTVSNDTGVAHIADALRAPSVVVYTASEPARWAALDRKLHRVVRSPKSVVRQAHHALSLPKGDVRRLDGDRATSDIGHRTPDDEDDVIALAIADARELLRAEGLYAA